jgi:Mg-chelatase subunit ChlD
LLPRRILLFAATWLLLGPDGSAVAARQRTGNVDAFVILDESGSMKPIFSRVTAYLGDALVRGYLVPGDYLCIVGFSDAPRVRVSQRVGSEAERDNLAAIVRDLNVVPAGHTDMGRSLEEALAQLDRLADPSHQQVVLFLTDGLNQPPRDSPYFDPVRPDPGRPVAPPSRFNARFREQVNRLAEKGYRVHVVGIGLETDARALALALDAGYTLLRQFDAQELTAGLGGFWDDTLNLLGAEAPKATWRPGEEIPLQVRIRSASDRDREVELGGARVDSLLTAAGSSPAEPPPIRVSLAADRWRVPARQDAAFEARVLLPDGFPAGDFRLRLAFDQRSAVKFYPQAADLTFHVPSFWESHGTKVVVGTAGLLGLVVGAALYRRRPIPVVLVVEGEPAADGAKPVRLRISASCSVGGGATDRLRIPGIPQRSAVLERRSVDRFALLSSKPDLIPTIPEYRLGDPVEVRGGGGATDRRVVRFVRARGKPAARRPRPAIRPPAPSGGPTSGVDFR